MDSKQGDLKVWWSCDFTLPPFEHPVASFDEAVKILNVLAKYDFYVHEQVYLNPEFTNACGLFVFDGTNWVEWEGEDGKDINAWARERRANASG